MSPEYKIRVSDRADEAFRNALSSVSGVRIISRIPPTEESERIGLLRKAVDNRRRKLMSEFAEAKPKEVQEKIDSAYQKLLKDVVGEGLTLTRPIKLEEFKRFFDNAVQGKSDGQEFPNSPRIRQGISTALILKYGLADGNPRTYNEIGRFMGFSRTYIGNLIHDGRRRLMGPMLRARILKLER